MVTSPIPVHCTKDYVVVKKILLRRKWRSMKDDVKEKDIVEEKWPSMKDNVKEKDIVEERKRC